MRIEKGYSDFNKLLKFENKVFKTDFKKLIPKVYSDERFLDCHYTIEENGELEGAFLRFPVDYKVNGKTVRGACIGGVAVDKKARGKGLMSEMMQFAVAQSKADGLDFLFLSGNRQRYERFGFVPAGYCKRLIFEKCNFKFMQCGPEYKFEKLTENDAKQAYELYVSQERYAMRNESDFVKYLRTWQTIAYKIIEKGRFVGFFGYMNGIKKIIGLTCPAEESVGIVKAFSEYAKLSKVIIDFENPFDAGFENLSEYAEAIHLVDCFRLCPLNFRNMLEAIGVGGANGLSGVAYNKSFAIDNGEKFAISIKDGKTEISDFDGKADFEWSAARATSEFFDTSFYGEFPFKCFFGICSADFS